jgi:hypothetical protein
MNSWAARMALRLDGLNNKRRNAVSAMFEALEPKRRLIIFLAEHLASFQIDKVPLHAGQTLQQIIKIIVVHLFGGPGLNGLPCNWTAIQQRSRHSARITQTKRRHPS